MKAKKIFCVVAYDIASDRHRDSVAKIIGRYGKRINYSVFECIFTEAQWEKVQEKIGKIIIVPGDRVVYYPICINCFTKIVYQPDIKGKSGIVNVI